ncbi:MAG: GIY-YIG nuclease family protein [Chitinophagaceae bacterium]|nr:MAG: GIY-YIG nuclease family protein [Chitinophagaceae bacterium]
MSANVTFPSASKYYLAQFFSYLSTMWYYVYILELNNKKHYIGCTTDVKERFRRHSKGNVPSTKAYRPLKLIWCCAFSDRYKAYQFERHLKSGSARDFTLRHLF